MDITHEPSHRQFTIDLGNQSAVLTYADRGEALDLTHVYVPQSHRGKGLAAELTTTALDYAREQGKKVIPSCPYVQQYLQRHEGYADLATARS